MACEGIGVIWDLLDDYQCCLLRGIELGAYCDWFIKYKVITASFDVLQREHDRLAGNRAAFNNGEVLPAMMPAEPTKI